ncbi:hypothetical protein F183_A54320 [Bryobacterales bacterium F-183]|nr:hypothetical protein F183_A54320 [Bryobacterales bacterium F-183]
MKLTRFLAFAIFAASAAFADNIVFTFGGTQSSLTLGSGSAAQASGVGTLVLVEREPSSTPYSINAGFSFFTGNRGTDDLAGGAPQETLNAGGGWTIFANSSINGTSFLPSEILLSGTFAPAQMANAMGTTAFGSRMIVTSVNQKFLDALGLPGIVANSTANSASFSRAGALAGTSFVNGPAGLNSAYLGTLAFEVAGTNAVPEPVELSFLILGGLGAASLIRKRAN